MQLCIILKTFALGSSPFLLIRKYSAAQIGSCKKTGFCGLSKRFLLNLVYVFILSYNDSSVI